MYDLFIAPLTETYFQKALIGGSIVAVVSGVIMLVMLLAAIVFITGLLPGLVLQPIAAVQAALGLPVVDYTPGGVAMAGGALDMIWVTGVLFGGFAVCALLFYSSGRTQHINQLDNYAGGHFLDADTRYQYSDNFYAGLMRVIKPW